MLRLKGCETGGLSTFERPDQTAVIIILLLVTDCKKTSQSHSLILEVDLEEEPNAYSKAHEDEGSNVHASPFYGHFNGLRR